MAFQVFLLCQSEACYKHLPDKQTDSDYTAQVDKTNTTITC